MKQFLEATRSAVQAGNSYAALALALVLPDMAAASQFPNSASKQRYIAWWKEYCEPKFTSEGPNGPHVFLGGSDAYALRCAVLHQGYDDATGHKAVEALDRYKFVQPTQGSMHRLQAGRQLVLQVDLLAEEICSSVEAFLETVSVDTEVQERLSRTLFVDPVPNGLRFRIG